MKGKEVKLHNVIISFIIFLLFICILQCIHNYAVNEDLKQPHQYIIKYIDGTSDTLENVSITERIF